MTAVAVCFVALTIFVGVVLLADVAPGRELRRWVRGHVGLALIAAALICVAAIGGNRASAWVGLGGVAATAAIGITLYAKVSSRTSHRVSPGILVVHGAAAAITIVAAALMALRG